MRARKDPKGSRVTGDGHEMIQVDPCVTMFAVTKFRVTNLLRQAPPQQ